MLLLSFTTALGQGYPATCTSSRNLSTPTRCIGASFCISDARLVQSAVTGRHQWPLVAAGRSSFPLQVSHWCCMDLDDTCHWLQMQADDYSAWVSLQTLRRYPDSVLAVLADTAVQHGREQLRLDMSPDVAREVVAVLRLGDGYAPPADSRLLAAVQVRLSQHSEVLYGGFCVYQLTQHPQHCQQCCCIVICMSLQHTLYTRLQIPYMTLSHSCCCAGLSQPRADPVIS